MIPMELRHTFEEASEATRLYADVHFPDALAVFLAGSWARNRAHADSDLDIIVIDRTVNRVMFEGTQYNGWIVDVCAINPDHTKSFFYGSAYYRSAPVPCQLADSILVRGNRFIAEQIRRQAIEAMERGPVPISDSDRLEMRFDLTLLYQDIAHAPPEDLPSLAAYTHTQLSRAVLDANRCWRAERKALHRAVAELDPSFAQRLDHALVEAIRGNPTPMIEACWEVISLLGGPQRTYERFSA